MSAWIVSKTHIDALVHAGIDAELIHPDEADEFGRMLWRENLASIHYRYPDTLEGGTYPGPIDFAPEDVEGYTFEPLDGGLGVSRQAPAVVHSTAACYSYQTCEHPEYHGSRAERFVLLLLDPRLNKPDGGPWGTDRRDAFLV